MKHDLHGGVRESICEWLKATDGERVDYRGFPAGRQLKQVNTVVEAVKTGGFGIDGEKRFAAESLKKALELGLVLDQANTGMRPIFGLWRGDHSERSPRALPRRNQSSVLFRDEIEPGCNLIESLGQSLVKLHIWLGRSPHGRIHLQFAGEAGGVADVVGCRFHGGNV